MRPRFLLPPRANVQHLAIVASVLLALAALAGIFQ